MKISYPGIFLAGFLLLSSSLSVQAQSADVYKDPEYGFSFKLPKGVEIEERMPHWIYLVENENKTEVYVQDFGKREGHKTNEWDFRSIAEERATVGFMADGPDGSVSGRVKERKDLHVGEFQGFTFIVQILASGNEEGSYPPEGYAYVFDLSDDNSFRVLVFTSALASKPISQKRIDTIVRTLKKI